MRHTKYLAILKVLSTFLGILILLLRIWELPGFGQGWQERISRFNPMGNLLDPLEDALPGLNVRGFLRFRPWLDLHGHSDRVGPGVNKNYDFPMLEWLWELEIRYKFRSNLELVNINNFLYDAYFDWEDISSTYYFGASYLQFLWVPDFEPSTPIPTAREGNPFGAMTPPPSSAVGFRQGSSDKPSASLLNHEFGLNFNTNLGRWDVSLFYFDHWDDHPTTFIRNTYTLTELDTDPETGRSVEKEVTIFDVERKYTRLHTFGMAADVFWWAVGRNWTGRVEGNYTLNDYVRQLGQPSLLPGVTKRNWLSTAYSASANFFNGELKTTLFLIYNRTFGWDENLRGTKTGNDRQDLFIYALSLSKNFALTNDRLGVTYIYAYTEDGDMRHRFDLSYKLSDHLMNRMTGKTALKVPT